MVTFKLAQHSGRPTGIVEIWNNGLLLGVIYPQEWGIRVCSKFMEESSISYNSAVPPVLEIRLP